MKTMTTIAALLATMLCGCRGPRPFGSADELGGHALASESQASEAPTLLTAMGGGSRPTRAAANLPVSELLSRAEQAIHSQQTVVARGHLQAILVQQPNHPRAHHLLAVIADLDGRYPEAEEHYFAALQQDPQNSMIVGDLGYSYYLQSRPESEQYLQRAIELDPGNTSATKNLAQLYSDRREIARAELLLRASLPAAEAEVALQQLHRQQPREDRSLLSNLGRGRSSEPTGEELTQQLREQMDAAARAEVAAREQRRREREFRGAALPQGSEPVDHFGRPIYGSEASINPWSRQLSAIDRTGVQAPAPSMLVGPGAPPTMDGPATHGMPTTAATGSPTVSPHIQRVGGQSDAGTLPEVHPAMETRSPGEAPAADTGSTSERRRWPPATWAPLTGTTGTVVQPPLYANRSSQSRQTHQDPVSQASGTVDPWNADVRHAVGHVAASDVRRADYQEDSSARTTGGAVRPVSAEDLDSRHSRPARGAASTMQQPVTQRTAPGTDSVWNGAQYPPPQRELPGYSLNQTDAAPSIRPAGSPAAIPRNPVAARVSADSYQSTRQSYNETMNDRVINAYAQSPTGRTPSPASAVKPPLYEVPAYPYGPAANPAPPVSTESGTPWPSRSTDPGVAPSGWTQGVPNTSTIANGTALPQYSPGVVVPEPYRGVQQPHRSSPTNHEYDPGPYGSPQGTAGRYR